MLVEALKTHTHTHTHTALIALSDNFDIFFVKNIPDVEKFLSFCFDVGRIVSAFHALAFDFNYNTFSPISRLIILGIREKNYTNFPRKAEKEFRSITVPIASR
jgi:hypothetical protein